MTRPPLEQLERIAERLASVAKEFEMVATISVHRKANHVGYLKTEASLIRGAIEQLRQGEA